MFDLNTHGSVVEVTTRTGDILNSWWLTFKDGSKSNMLGGNYQGGGDHHFSYPDEILSSIKIMGVSRFYGSADCAVFGFKFVAEKTLPDPAVLRSIYVASPLKVSPEELIQYTGVDKQEEMAKRVREWIRVYQWDEIRQRHWETIRVNIESDSI
ncbi:hypothetical protein [Bacillus solitudinis]|uniref:hypothetical protein n=1 Tax=Bacillus solitudinis TaxID=2014074 RepID=UPI000C24C8FE|nr:hypothetical protein [Bacillus solitudinis]